MGGGRKGGEWRGGKRNGRGFFGLADGRRYEGDYKDGKEHGRGVFVFANSDKCEGDWREGRLLGMGKGRENGQSKKCYEDDGTIKFTD